MEDKKMKGLRILVFGSFAFVLALMGNGIINGEISGDSGSYEYSEEQRISEEEAMAQIEAALAEGQGQTESQIQAPAQTETQAQASAPQTASESQTTSQPAYSETNQTAPEPDELFSASDLIGKWVDDTDPDQVWVVDFYIENNQLMHRYYLIVPGNEYGVNIANEVTEWECSEGVVSIQLNQGRVSCHVGTKDTISVAFYYGFDGPDVMRDQTDGTAFYRAE